MIRWPQAALSKTGEVPKRFESIARSVWGMIPKEKFPRDYCAEAVRIGRCAHSPLRVECVGVWHILDRCPHAATDQFCLRHEIACTHRIDTAPW